MCSICGIFNPRTPEKIDKENIYAMNAQLKHRGPDQSGFFINDGIALGHNRLAVIDVENGIQPMTALYEGRKYTIVYNGEIYNAPELTQELKGYGIEFSTKCDTEVVLYSYIIWGEDCTEKLNGIFAFVVYDEAAKRLFAVRDRFGIKPFFFAYMDDTFLFASEIKALLQYKGMSAKVDQYGLWQLFYLTPVTLRGKSVFKNIFELKAAECAVIDENGIHKRTYWTLRAEEFSETPQEAIEHTQALLTDAINRQLVSDVPLCTFLSGGLDSSIITAVAAKNYRERGMRLSSYSFEYEGNQKSFKNSLFQPESDDVYAGYLADYLGTNHTVLTVPSDQLAEYLLKAAYARDMPGQADIDSSLLYFCEKVKMQHTVALSGECADEIFGGYPWFYRPEMLKRNFFPWIHQPMARINLLRDEIANGEEGFNYLSEIFKDTIQSCPTLESDSDAMRTSRIATCLSVHYFMESLLERKDRMSMASGVEVRVPFSDHRILEYVYNVPWEIKFQGGVEKALLRNAMADYLPDKILHRKKSPYPKTHNPEYEEIVRKMLTLRLENKDSMLSQILRKTALEALYGDADVTWFGQLMSKPQLIAWLIQLDYWFEKYQVEIV